MTSLLCHQSIAARQQQIVWEVCSVTHGIRVSTSWQLFSQVYFIGLQLKQIPLNVCINYSIVTSPFTSLSQVVTTSAIGLALTLYAICTLLIIVIIWILLQILWQSELTAFEFCDLLLHLWYLFDLFVTDLKASDVVRQPKIVDMSRGVVRDASTDSGSRLRTSETAPDSLYSRNAANGDSVNIGIEWSGGDVRSFCELF